MKTPDGDENQVPSSEGDENRSDEQSSPTSPNVMKTPIGDKNQVSSSEGDENRSDEQSPPTSLKSYKNSRW